MKLSSIKSRKNSGFTLVELITTIVVVAVLSALSLGIITNLSTQAKLNAKIANASALTSSIANVSAAGGSVAAGAANTIDTTSVTTELGKFPVTVNGITFTFNNTMTAASYTTTAAGVVSSDGLTTTAP